MKGNAKKNNVGVVTIINNLPTPPANTVTWLYLRVVRFYRIFNLLSLDVALGAVVSAALFARILRVTVLPQGFVLLGISVWLIYTADHLLDAWSMREMAISQRHKFHQQNFLTVIIVFAAAVAIATGLLFLIRIQLITAGLVFGTFVIIYLLLSRWLKYFKELAGSLLYTGGVLLPSWSIHTQPLSNYQLTFIVIFALIAFTNMLIFARFSMEEDIMNRQKSLATIMGVRPMNSLISIVTTVCFCVMIYEATVDSTAELGMLFLMEIVLLVVFLVRYFKYNDRYRIYGDAIFLLPAILFIVPLPPAAALFFLPSTR
jgi:hypothetical protein